ncbi:hypothetical protein NBRC3255_1048 [Gluconobacter thailandicus NBRC 3255]|nr:hypothetical protein NBRC3255_1048 [Gluconobacter thailandicus NBRC 3255]
MRVLCMIIKNIRDVLQNNRQNSATFLSKCCDIYVAFSSFETESFSGGRGVSYRMLDPGFKS